MSRELNVSNNFGQKIEKDYYITSGKIRLTKSMQMTTRDPEGMGVQENIKVPTGTLVKYDKIEMKNSNRVYEVRTYSTKAWNTDRDGSEWVDYHNVVTHN
jgi:hypothetical protein